VTLLAVVLAWIALSVLTVLGLAMLFSGRGRWERRARESAADVRRVEPAPVSFPLAG